jgi:hypothetical protein
MSDTPESNKAKIAFTSLFANDDAYWVPFKVSCKLERERDEALSDLEFRRDLFKLQEQQLNDVRAERDEARETAERYRLEANAMMMQRDRIAEELKEAQNAIEMMLRDSSCRRIPAYTEEQLAAVKGGSDG